MDISEVRGNVRAAVIIVRANASMYGIFSGQH